MFLDTYRYFMVEEGVVVEGWIKIIFIFYLIKPTNIQENKCSYPTPPYEYLNYFFFSDILSILKHKVNTCSL